MVVSSLHHQIKEKGISEQSTNHIDNSVKGRLTPKEKQITRLYSETFKELADVETGIERNKTFKNPKY